MGKDTGYDDEGALFVEVGGGCDPMAFVGGGMPICGG